MMSRVRVNRTVHELAAMLRQAREKRGLSQEIAAQLAGLSEGWLYKVENGRADPLLGNLLKLTDVLGVDLAELLSASRRRVTDGAVTGKLEPEEDEDTRRRTFLAWLATMPTMDVERMVDLERLAAPTLDAAHTRDAEAVTDGLMQSWYTVSPAALLPAASGHLSGLRGFMPGPRELARVTARTALFVAMLTVRLPRLRGQAYGAFALAQAAARDGGDRAHEALAVGMSSSLYSTVSGWPREGNTMRALELLDGAVRMVDSGAPGRLRAVLLSRRAEERAVLRDGDGAMSDLEASDVALSQPGRDFFFGVRSTRELGALRGNVELLLGRNREAVATLDRTLADMDSDLVSWRAAVLADQGAVFARMGELEEAVDCLERALQLARMAGDQEQRVRGVRHRDLAGWDAESAVRRLDEQIEAG